MNAWQEHIRTCIIFFPTLAISNKLSLRLREWSCSHHSPRCRIACPYATKIVKPIIVDRLVYVTLFTAGPSDNIVYSTVSSSSAIVSVSAGGPGVVLH